MSGDVGMLKKMVCWHALQGHLRDNSEAAKTNASHVEELHIVILHMRFLSREQQQTACPERRSVIQNAARIS